MSAARIRFYKPAEPLLLLVIAAAIIGLAGVALEAIGRF